ncbi:MAG: GNAT family N-acetyltransferase [Phycisphaeraceae bacterium]|nr:GNAT family N-acetyltransferase [Phycisphaeraceae bacterium]
MIERLASPASERDVLSLAALLIDAVEAGDAVSFVAPLGVEAAQHWWRGVIEGMAPKGAVLVAREGDRIVGTVQLRPAWAPNQPHRAEVAKLIVHRSARGRRLGRDLMDAVERAARDAGFWLLTLDARSGGVAEGLYRRMGWRVAGTIPRFALDPDGAAYHDAVFMYRELGRE